MSGLKHTVVVAMLLTARGGAEDYLVRLIRSAAGPLRRELACLFFHETCYAHYGSTLQELGVHCEVARGGPLRKLWHLAGLIRRRRPAVVYMNGMCDPAAKVAWLKLLFPSARFCMTNHVTPDPSLDSKKWAALRKINRSFRTLPLFMVADPLIFVSRQQVGLMARNRFFRPRKPLVIHNGVQLPGRSKASHGSGPLVVGLVGNYVFYKKYEFALAACDILLTSGLDFAIHHYGSPGADLAQTLSPANRGRFVTGGYVHDIDSIYQAIDVLFAPGTYESFCYVAAEAMAYGIPVLLPDTELYRELYGEGDDAACLFFRKDDVDDAASKLQLLLTDAGLRERLALAGRKVVEERYDLAESNRRAWQAILGPAFGPELLCSPGARVTD